MKEKNKFYDEEIKLKAIEMNSVYRTKTLKGEFTGPYAPYGFQIEPGNKYHLIIDSEKASIVKRIFDYALEGITPFKIASLLKQDSILKPRAKMMKDLKKYVSE
ncbi:MAG: hypothetical protein WCZ19_01090 [Acholeplasma sp.]